MRCKFLSSDADAANAIIRSSRRHGFTLIEMLVIVAILGILLALSPISFRAPVVKLYSNDLKSQINQARYEAIKRNRPVAVLWSVEDSRLETRVNDSPATIGAACSSTTVINTKATSDYRDVIVTAGSRPLAVAFLPSGQARWCDGNIFAESEAILAVSDGRTTRRVSVTPAGKVNVQ